MAHTLKMHFPCHFARHHLSQMTREKKSNNKNNERKRHYFEVCRIFSQHFIYSKTGSKRKNWLIATVFDRTTFNCALLYGFRNWHIFVQRKSYIRRLNYLFFFSIIKKEASFIWKVFRKSCQPKRSLGWFSDKMLYQRRW